jgi:hypothetical protein
VKVNKFSISAGRSASSSLLASFGSVRGHVAAAAPSWLCARTLYVHRAYIRTPHLLHAYLWSARLPNVYPVIIPPRPSKLAAHAQLKCARKRQSWKAWNRGYTWCIYTSVLTVYTCNKLHSNARVLLLGPSTLNLPMYLDTPALRGFALCKL